MSFSTIGIIWLNHHAVLDHVRRADRGLLFLNLLLLLWVAFIPFPTALLAVAFVSAPRPSQSTPASAIYYALAQLGGSIASPTIEEGHADDR